MAGFTKKRREIEPRWVSEYVAEFYPSFEVRMRCPLGSIPESLTEVYGFAKATRIHRPYRPEVDALVILPGELILIEAKIAKYMDGLSKLPIYKGLVAVTPELEDVKDRRVMMHLLVPKKINWIMEAARQNNVIVRDWAPPWLTQIWEERDKYWSREATLKRQQRRKVLNGLGFT